MKVALIAPRNLLPYTRYGDMHFIVPANADAAFFAKEKMYKILDNGTYEAGTPLSDEELIRLAQRLYVDEIILPDVMFQEVETHRRTETFIETQVKRYKYAAVPQAKTPLEWMRAYEAMAQIPNIDVLCIPIWLQKKFGCRPAVVHALLKRGQWSTQHQHHLIGLDGFGELHAYPLGIIRSVDTSLPFSRAIADLLLTFEDSKLSRVTLEGKLIYNLDTVRRNIDQLLQVAHQVA